MARSEYSRLRSIAQRRIDRLVQSGLADPGLRFPTVKEIGSSKRAKERALENVLNFLASGTTVKEARKENLFVKKPTRKGQAPKVLSPEEKKAAERRAKRKAAEEKRKEVIQSLDKTGRAFIKGLKKLKVVIPTKQLPAFAEYMKFRMSQAGDSEKYLVAHYTEDFVTIMKSKPHSIDSVRADFRAFLIERDDLMKEFVNSTGTNAERIKELWDAYVKS